MGYQRGYDRSRGDDDRWQERGGRSYRDRSDHERNQGRQRETGRGYGDRDESGRHGRDDDDRGFFDRGADEVRSWFGDEEAERRREADQRRYEREQGYSGDRSRQGGGYYGSGSDQSTREYPRGDYGQDSSYTGMSAPGTAAETWGGSGFGGASDRGRRFDRVDSGSTGTHGAHPMSAATGGGYGGGYGVGTYGASQSSARYSGGGGGGGGGSDHDHHDRSYSQWRNRQIESLDRDYEEYRRENQSRFEQEFGGWRQKRESQRSSLRKVTEHMEVVGSDGDKVGTVDKVRGDRIILTKSDPEAGGKHHSIPCSWIESVEEQVKLSKTGGEAQAAWKDEEHSRALFEDEDQGRGGPGMLNRSFSGTY